MKTKRIFIHGLESTSRGAKGEFFRKNYPDMILEDYTGPLRQRMDRLNETLHRETAVILVGHPVVIGAPERGEPATLMLTAEPVIQAAPRLLRQA